MPDALSCRLLYQRTFTVTASSSVNINKHVPQCKLAPGVSRVVEQGSVPVYENRLGVFHARGAWQGEHESGKDIAGKAQSKLRQSQGECKISTVIQD